MLAGKSSPDGDALWLPLWMHARDTAEVMRLLVRHWLPESVRGIIGLEEERLVRTACFLGAAHDIGKATVVFQSNILRHIPEARDRVAQALSLRERLQSDGKTPHARASEAILLELGCPAGLASIAGAHHGKPQENEANNYISEQIEVSCRIRRGYAIWDTVSNGRRLCYAGQGAGTGRRMFKDSV